jgi:hypothetical protein
MLLINDLQEIDLAGAQTWRTLEAAANKVPYASQSTCSPRNGLRFHH